MQPKPVACAQSYPSSSSGGAWRLTGNRTGGDPHTPKNMRVITSAGGLFPAAKNLNQTCEQEIDAGKSVGEHVSLGPSNAHDETVDSVSSFQPWNDEKWTVEDASPRSFATEPGIWSPKLVVFSGGTAMNSVAGKLLKFTTCVSHVLPVSDDGGSTAEIVRVLGGPAVGDIRSRCLRLADDSDDEAIAVRALLGHRLPSDCEAKAKEEWYAILEGVHELWDSVSEPYKHTIRAFLVYFHNQILRHSTQMFRFRNGSVGNFFFAGARIFFRSLDAAIFLFSRVARIPEGSKVLPAIQTEERITLGAELENGTIVRGQSEISHPSGSGCIGPDKVDKLCDGPALPSAIRRVFYLSSEGTNREHEVHLKANMSVLSEIQQTDAVIYGMGSLYTSICPSLLLTGVGETIAGRKVPKILVLNGRHDRETSKCRGHSGPMCATDVIWAVVNALNRGYSANQSLPNKPSTYITALLVPKGGSIRVDEEQVKDLGIKVIVQVDSTIDKNGHALFEPDALVEAVARVIEIQKDRCDE